MHLITHAPHHTCTPTHRDDAQHKMVALKEKSDKEVTQCNTELKVESTVTHTHLFTHLFTLLTPSHTLSSPHILPHSHLKELIRVVDHDRKLKEFMTCKDRERTEAHEEMETMRRMKGACEGGREGEGSTVYNDECVSPSDAEKSSDRERTVMVSIQHSSTGCSMQQTFRVLVTISSTSDPLLSVL